MFKILNQKQRGKLQKSDLLQFENPHIGVASFQYAESASAIVVKSISSGTHFRVQGLLLPGAKVV